MSFQRPQTLVRVAQHLLEGGTLGYEIKDFLHEFQDRQDFSMLEEEPPRLEHSLDEGRRMDAFLQALAVYLAVQLKQSPPAWTQEAIQLAHPWFASPGTAIRNYLLISSPAPFRARNLFIDEDSLRVV